MSTERSTHRSPWFLQRQARPDATLRLFCIPFAGGGASAFNAWWSRLPDWVELRAVQLPGRETRLRETPFSNLDAAVAALADAIRPELDRPFALFGYSMGALLGFELARELRRRGAPLPDQVHVAARAAPQLPATTPPMARLPRREFLEHVARFFEPPEEAWSVPELLSLILPALRADFTLCDDYRYRPEPPLPCALFGLAGTRDRSVPTSAVSAWCEQTSGAFELDVVPGSHFFINTAVDDVLSSLVGRLARMRPQTAR